MSRILDRTLDEAPPEGTGFTFDDAIFRSNGADETAAAPFRLSEADDQLRPVESPARPRRVRRARRRPPGPRPSAARPAGETGDDSVSARGLSISLGLCGASLLLLGLLFFGLQRENLGVDPLAQWRSAATSPLPSLPAHETPAPAATEAGVAAATAPASRGVQRIRVPAVPGPLAMGRTTPAAALPPPATPAPSAEIAQAADAAEATEAWPLAESPGVAPLQEESDGETLFALAEEYRQLGDSERARQLYHRLFREGRQPGRAALALGDLYLELERFAEAREMFDLSKELFVETKRTHATRR